MTEQFSSLSDLRTRIELFQGRQPQRVLNQAVRILVQHKPDVLPITQNLPPYPAHQEPNQDIHDAHYGAKAPPVGYLDIS